MSIETEYTLEEAAARLGWACTTLRDKCSKKTVPHHRRHLVKGIFFTDDDIDQIQARQLRQPALAPPIVVHPSPDREDRTPQEAEIDAALATLDRRTRVASAS